MVFREEIMMKHIFRNIISLLIIFVIGFTAGIAVNKYQNTNTSHDVQLNTDALCNSGMTVIGESETGRQA